jgi:hypothetical protein
MTFDFFFFSHGQLPNVKSLYNLIVRIFIDIRMLF